MLSKPAATSMARSCRPALSGLPSSQALTAFFQIVSATFLERNSLLPLTRKTCLPPSRLKLRSLAKVLPAMPVTASFGVTQHVPGETAQNLLQRADSLLYEAKAAGRNRTLPEL